MEANELNRLTLKGVLLRSAPGEGINMASEAGRRAEPANTPLVEQARLLATRDPRYGACVWGAGGRGESGGSSVSPGAGAQADW